MTKNDKKLDKNNNGFIGDDLKKQRELENKQKQKELKEKIAKNKFKINYEVRREIFKAYKLIIGAVVEQVFYEKYGDTFELYSLQASLIYTEPTGTSGLIPSVTYNPNIFRFNHKYFREASEFNENARNQNRKNKIFLTPSFYADGGAVSTSDFLEQVYDPLEANIVQQSGFEKYDYTKGIMKDVNQLVPVNKRNKVYTETLDMVYTRALKKAKTIFMSEYNNSIKPRLEKKYNVKL